MKIPIHRHNIFYKEDSNCKKKNLYFILNLKVKVKKISLFK